VAKNLMRHAGKEVMAHMSGQRRYQQTRHSGFRMAEAMRDEISSISKPSAPSGSSAPTEPSHPPDLEP